ncbi:MAG: glycosyltransferase [Methyloprofundus sp.]|nr:glycosyltransferase [Methyloprofundus sp.]
MATDHAAESMAVGCGTYSVTPWTYPDPSEYTTLGIKTNHDGILDCGYPIRILPDFNQALSDLIDEFKPDVIWSQLEGAVEVLELAKAKGIQGLYYVHDAEFDVQELCKIADLGCHIVCSSGFLADKAQRVIGRSTYTLYPSAELYFATKNDPNGFITMINPHRVKGLPTFLKIAQQLPEQQFLLVESWKLNNQALAELHEQLAQLPNIQFMHRVSDMRIIYAQTKLLLIPSIWEEGFGMVAIEGQSCRIPVIASQRGGLTESVGTGGILIEDYQNVEKWLTAVAQVLASPHSYASFSERAYQHATSDNFTPKVLAAHFLQICTSPAPLMDGLQHYIQLISRKLPKFYTFLKMCRIVS